MWELKIELKKVKNENETIQLLEKLEIFHFI